MGVGFPRLNGVVHQALSWVEFRCFLGPIDDVGSYAAGQGTRRCLHSFEEQVDFLRIDPSLLSPCLPGDQGYIECLSVCEPERGS